MRDKLLAALQQVIAAPKTITLYRGFSLLPEEDEPELILDPLYHGQGIFGEGTYYTPKKEIAQSYGQELFQVKFSFKNLLTISQDNATGYEDAGSTDTLIVDEKTQELLDLSDPEFAAHQLAEIAFAAGFDGIHFESRQTDGGEQIVIPAGAKPKILSKKTMEASTDQPERSKIIKDFAKQVKILRSRYGYIERIEEYITPKMTAVDLHVVIGPEQDIEEVWHIDFNGSEFHWLDFNIDVKLGSTIPEALEAIELMMQEEAPSQTLKKTTSNILAALQHVVLADRSLHDSGNLKTYIQRKDLDAVLKLADCWYELPFDNKGREAVQMAIDMGRDAKEHTIYRIMLNNYFIYFIGTEDSIMRKLGTIPDEADVEKQAEEKSQTTTTPAPKLSDRSSPKMSDGLN